MHMTKKARGDIIDNAKNIEPDDEDDESDSHDLNVNMIFTDIEVALS